MRELGWGWAAWLALAAGCDASGFSDYGDSGSDTAADTGEIASTRSTISSPTTAMMGTQVGSEGFWTCPVLGVQDLGDGTATIAALDGAPVALAAARVGTWPVQMTDTADAEQAPGALELTDDGVYLWVDVEEGAGCVDHLVVAVRGVLSRDQAWTLPMTGALAIRPGEGHLILTGDGPLTEVEATWGASPLDPALTAFRVEVGIDLVQLAGTASYVDCGAVTCTGTAPLATITGAR